MRENQCSNLDLGLQPKLDHEEYRHQCEVRQLLKWRTERGLQWFRQYISDHGFGGRKTKLLGNVTEQWKLGNRGEKGLWK